MKKLGIRGFADYLNERKQRVVMKGNYSSWVNIIAGVPQGSILGPILYPIFAEDVCQQIRSGLRMFADDTLLFSIGIAEKECSKIIQPSLDAVHRWASRWKVLLNPRKTKCVTFSRVGSLKYPLTLNYLFVEEFVSHCHLEIELSHDGKWGCHLTKICAKATKRLCILRRYSRRFNRTNLYAIFKSFILPILEYGSILMSNMTQGDNDKLEEIHRSALRCVTGCKLGTSHKPLYKEVDAVTLAARARVCRLIKFYKLRTENRDYRLGSSYVVPTISRNPRAIRRQHDFIPEKCHTESLNQSFLPRTIQDWNDLPETTKEAGSVGSFKQKIKHLPKPNPVYCVE